MQFTEKLGVVLEGLGLVEVYFKKLQLAIGDMVREADLRLSRMNLIDADYETFWFAGIFDENRRLVTFGVSKDEPNMIFINPSFGKHLSKFRYLRADSFQNVQIIVKQVLADWQKDAKVLRVHRKKQSELLEVLKRIADNPPDGYKVEFGIKNAMAGPQTYEFSADRWPMRLFIGILPAELVPSSITFFVGLGRTAGMIDSTTSDALDLLIAAKSTFSDFVRRGGTWHRQGGTKLGNYVERSMWCMIRELMGLEAEWPAVPQEVVLGRRVEKLRQSLPSSVSSDYGMVRLKYEWDENRWEDNDRIRLEVRFDEKAFVVSLAMGLFLRLNESILREFADELFSEDVSTWEQVRGALLGAIGA